MRARRGQTLVATLIVIAIIAILAVVLLTGGRREPLKPEEGGRPDGKGLTLPGLAKARAQDEACRSNLKQVRSAIEIAKVGSDENPGSIEETRIGANFYSCPLGKEKYVYDPATGEVGCPHPGHEKY